jgi:hypothetical protein
LNTKNLDNSTRFLTISHTTLSAKRFRRYGILTIDITAEFCSWTDQQPKRISNFQTRIGRNSGSAEYRFGRKLSQLSDGLLNGSNRLAICELRQSETRPDAEITFQADHTFLYKTGSWRNFAMTSPETLHTKNVSNELSFPLVTHMTHFDIRFGCYGILKYCFGSRPAFVRSGFWATRWVRLARVRIQLLKKLSQLSDAYSNTRFG